jgi:uncharacterized phage-associated protein
MMFARKSAMATRSLAAAQYIVANSKPAVTPMRLLKLLYVAHGYSLAVNRQPLLDESVEAWQYGPMVPSVYQAVRKYRSKPVESMGRIGGCPLSEADLLVLDKVLTTYQHVNAIQLSAAMHQPGTPWSITWGMDEQNAPISNDLIMDFYQNILKAPTHCAL